MRNRSILMALLLFGVAAAPASAQNLESLNGQFTFNWHMEPSKTRCAAVDRRLLALFASPAYRCNLTPVKNTASGHEARVCTEVGGGAEYLIFRTKRACEDERRTQDSNSEN